ncbi:stromal cell-derived factor 2-like [Saccoglossus kowalevskii]|uniref:Stromal cell-derived factor 2-like n=1 Tax=Saccoglossus kowalevskii TaxID=10224 RepID=A0A0U2USC7_SACKO|nr:PREDICTED: stromal cell-derived factor 2-like [Saccoglossus kowalevskii]ALR88646.1 stromal cell-derived factor 2-like 036 [Saccoglossus kowalevskii]
MAMSTKKLCADFFCGFLVVSSFCLILSTFADDEIIEYEFVTCGSVIKLKNSKYNVRLHSHDVKYGSGSGQQSVTGMEKAGDGNSYWQIKGKTQKSCQRGTPIKCGQSIRLLHLNTKRNLHSHMFESPLSNNQEVSAFGEEGEGDEGDNWAITCSSTLWRRDQPVRLKHVATEAYLAAVDQVYGRPIRGQREIAAISNPSQATQWTVMEGIYVKPDEE